jgi:hypothetical protein
MFFQKLGDVATNILVFETCENIIGKWGCAAKLSAPSELALPLRVNLLEPVTGTVQENKLLPFGENSLRKTGVAILPLTVTPSPTCRTTTLPLQNCVETWALTKEATRIRRQ